MNLQELSEVCFGLILEGRHPASLYKPEWFATPYDRGVEILLQKGTTKEDVAQVLSSAYLSDASSAVHHFNGIGEYANYDWAKALRMAADQLERGKKLKKLADAMMKNEPVDILPVHAELTAAIAGAKSGLQLASEIDEKAYKPFIKCGYKPLDMTLGGIPADGPIIIMMPTGTGKSKLATAIINGLLHQYPEKKAAVYTLEMNEVHWKWRSFNLYPTLKEVQDRLYVSGAVRDIDEAVAEITAMKADYVVIDDMDNIVRAQEAAEYERVYRRIKEICRFMGIPVFVLAQPNRAAKFDISTGLRFPSLYDSAWSGASENSSALFLAGLTTSALDMKSTEFPTTDDKMDYLIAWKSRDGWPADYDPKLQRGPGAIIMKHTSNWMGEPFGGKWKIWSPDSGGKAIGKPKRKSEE